MRCGDGDGEESDEDDGLLRRLLLFVELWWFVVEGLSGGIGQGARVVCGC